MRVTFRPTVRDDLRHCIGDRPLPHRIRAITATIGDQVLGVGGIGFQPNGAVIAFAHMTDEARKYPVAIHRAGVMAMAMIREARIPIVVAEADINTPAAERWLLRLGFEPIITAGIKAFVWRPAR